MIGFDWRQDDDVTASLFAGNGRRLARYSWSDRKNHPYFWDVTPVNHDGVLTNHAPWDHRWHHGLWWSWKFVNDVLYWEDHEGYGNGRGAGLGRSHVTSHTATPGADDIALVEHLEWRPSGSDHVALREERRLRIHADLDAESSWAVDWDLSWTAPDGAVLSTTPYPEFWWGGYAGLNYRAARAMIAEETILASDGRVGRQAVHAQEARWMAYGGNTDGSGEDEPSRPAKGSVVIIPDPANVTGPTPAWVFSAHEELGLLAAAPLMHRDWTIPAGGTLALRYRTVIIGHGPDAEVNERLYQQYIASPAASH